MTRLAKHKIMQNIKCSYSKIVSADELIPNPKNPNKHNQKQIDLLAKNIDFQGQRHPIIVSNRSGFICAGHGRLEAIKKLKWDKCAVDYQDFKSEAEEYAFMVADNKLAELAENDDNMMVQDLKDMDFDLDFEFLGMLDFNMITNEFTEDLKDKPKDDSIKKYIIEIEFPNDMEMMDIHDDLLNRGYIVRIK
jgi:hypothetical protein